MGKIKTKKKGDVNILRILAYILGIIIISISISFMYLYTNVMAIGFTFADYLLYISKRWECWMVFAGVFLLIFSFKERRHEK